MQKEPVNGPDLLLAHPGAKVFLEIFPKGNRLLAPSLPGLEVNQTILQVDLITLQGEEVARSHAYSDRQLGHGALETAFGHGIQEGKELFRSEDALTTLRAAKLPGYRPAPLEARPEVDVAELHQVLAYLDVRSRTASLLAQAAALPPGDVAFDQPIIELVGAQARSSETFNQPFLDRQELGVVGAEGRLPERAVPDAVLMLTKEVVDHIQDLGALMNQARKAVFLESPIQLDLVAKLNSLILGRKRFLDHASFCRGDSNLKSTRS